MGRSGNTCRIPFMKVLPVFRAVKIVHHQESALEQILPQPLGLGVGERPRLHLHRINPWVVEDLVGIQRDYLFRRPAVDPGKAVHGNQKLAVGLGIVARPRRSSPIAVVVGSQAGHAGRIRQPRPVELGLHVGGSIVVAESEVGRPLERPQPRAASCGHNRRQGQLRELHGGPPRRNGDAREYP